MTRDHNDAILTGWNDYLSIASLVGKVSWEYDGLKAINSFALSFGES